MSFEPANMHARLELEFSQDILFKHAMRNKSMSGKLIDRFMEELDYLKTYSSTAFEEWYCNPSDPENYLGLSQSSMRRWLGEFNEYIEARRTGRNWDLDYRAIFRLRMLLLYRANGYKPKQLQELLGLKAITQLLDDDDLHNQYQPNSYEPAPQNETTFNEESLKVFASIAMQMIQHGLVVMDPEKGPILQLALPGVDDQLQEIREKIDSNEESVEQLRKKTEDQEELIKLQQAAMDKQGRFIQTLSEITEMALAYQSHKDPEILRKELQESRQKDPEMHFNVMMKLIQDNKSKKKSGFFQRLFGR